MRKVNLNYQPIAKRKSHKVAFVVSAKHAIAVDRAIERKIKINEAERIASWQNAGNYVVK